MSGSGELPDIVLDDEVYIITPHNLLPVPVLWKSMGTT